MTPLCELDFLVLEAVSVVSEVVAETRPRLQGHDEGVLEWDPLAGRPPEADALEVHDVLVAAEEPQFSRLSVGG